MSLDKAIEHGKEKRKLYRGVKAFDSSCRNHGSCLWCKRNRKRIDFKLQSVVEDEMNEFSKEEGNNGESVRQPQI